MKYLNQDQKEYQARRLARKFIEQAKRAVAQGCTPDKFSKFADDYLCDASECRIDENVKVSAKAAEWIKQKAKLNVKVLAQ